ncbi:Hypothetical_protein [Hexamita inflata]|uniref:Hypothetical_protein n=1 Tax=Hexamita inflata TaxID=28002 RepID=A0AA86PRF9_9EUKA|nr:Hypothetical protein HINF_LOCUS32434 [Hexamita inflata]
MRETSRTCRMKCVGAILEVIQHGSSIMLYTQAQQKATYVLYLFLMCLIYKHYTLWILEFVPRFSDSVAILHFQLQKLLPFNPHIGACTVVTEQGTTEGLQLNFKSFYLSQEAFLYL